MKKLILFFTVLCLFACSNINNYELAKSTGKNYKTEYVVHWATGVYTKAIIYSNDSIYTCSFQGTNFLLEKNNSEELFSTTAPIQIVSIEKLN